MASYVGSYIVVNGSSDTTITNVNVSHAENGSAASASSLAPGHATAPIAITSDGTDNWTVSFELNGTTYSRSGKECGLESEDNGQVCVLILYPSNFSVVTPQSSGCFNNHY